MKTTQIRMQQAVVRSGTMCVVQTPEALVGITNNHVLETYERHRPKSTTSSVNLVARRLTQLTT